MHIFQLHNLMKQPTITITKRLHHNSKFSSVLAKRKMRLKYEIPIQQMCWHAKLKQQLLSMRPAETDFSLRLHGEINFHLSKAGQVFTGICLQKPIDSHWFKKVYKMMKFYKNIVYIFLTDWSHMIIKIQ